MKTKTLILILGVLVTIASVLSSCSKDEELAIVSGLFVAYASDETHYYRLQQVGEDSVAVLGHEVLFTKFKPNQTVNYTQVRGRLRGYDITLRFKVRPDGTQHTEFRGRLTPDLTMMKGPYYGIAQDDGVWKESLWQKELVFNKTDVPY